MAEIVPVDSGAALEEARALFVEYAQSLDFSLSFQGFNQELAGLPGDYAPPDGRLLLALHQNQTVGCVGLRKIGPGVCEMKRLFVRPHFRGLGIGRKLAETIIAEACCIGYRCMRLDTVPAMEHAIALYQSLGFKQTAPYCRNPLSCAMFMELDLTAPPAQASCAAN